MKADGRAKRGNLPIKILNLPQKVEERIDEVLEFHGRRVFVITLRKTFCGNQFALVVDFPRAFECGQTQPFFERFELFQYIFQLGLCTAKV